MGRNANIDKVVEGLWWYFPLKAEPLRPLTAGRNRDGDRKITSTQLNGCWKRGWMHFQNGGRWSEYEF